MASIGPIQQDSDIEAAHYIANADADPTPANNVGLVPVLEATGRLHKNFVPSDAVYTADIAAFLEKLEGVGPSNNVSRINDTIPFAPDYWLTALGDFMTDGNMDYTYAHSVTNRTEGGNYVRFGEIKELTFADDFEVEVEIRLSGSDGGIDLGWGVGANSAFYNGFISKESPEYGADGVGFHTRNGNLYARSNTGVPTMTEVEITGITLTDNNRYRIEHEAGTAARFYVNGNLEATITTQLPNGGDTYFGYGSRGSGSSYTLHSGQPRVSY